MRKLATRALLAAAAASVAVIGLPRPAVAQTYVDYHQLPVFAAKDAASLATFQSLFDSAANSTVRLGILGDSQELSINTDDASRTIPGSQAYVDTLSAGFANKYGNVPETRLAVLGTNYPFGSTVAPAFLLGNTRIGGTPVTNIPANLIAPGLGPVSLTGGQSSTTILLPDASGTVVGLTNGKNYLASGYNGGTGSVTAQVFVATNTNAGALTFAAQPTSGTNVNTAALTTNSGTLYTGAQLTSNTFAVTSKTVTLNYSTGNPYMQLTLTGTGANNAAADVVGVRFQSSNPAGVAVQDLAIPGALTGDLTSALASTGAMIQALGMDVVMLHTGANDVFRSGGLTPATFESDQKNLIAAIRSAANNPNLKVILASDPNRYINGVPIDQSGQAGITQADYDELESAQYDIAQSDPNVLFLNSRLLSDQAGWTIANTGNYVFDSVHYNTLGGQTMGSIEAAALTGIPEPGTALVAAGVAGLLLRRRSRARNV